MANRILNPTKAQRKHVGYVWYNLVMRRPIYGPVRKVTRGKKKGWFEVWILACSDEFGIYLKKVINKPEKIIWLDD